MIFGWIAQMRADQADLKATLEQGTRAATQASLAGESNLNPSSGFVNRLGDLGNNASIDWQPASTAPSGRWVLGRICIGNDKHAVWQMCQIGGYWFVPKDRTLEQFEFTKPVSYQAQQPICYLGAPSNTPDEWCDIPDQIQESLVNRVRVDAK